MRARELQTSQWGISAEPDIIIQMLFVCLQWRTSSFSYVRPDTWRIALLVLSRYLHQPESHQLSFNNVSHLVRDNPDI